MPGSAAALSEREKEVLRLLLLGHDAKSAARECKISVHTVNERLRSARRKLGASSSREAARLLATEESGGAANSSVYRNLPVERPSQERSNEGLPGAWAVDTSGSHKLIWSGVAMLAITAIGLAVLTAAPGARAPGGPPKVVATNPQPGAVIAAGPLTLTVTFDRPMLPGNYSFVQISAETYPNCGSNVPEQSEDRRTFTMRCNVEPGRSYEVWFNRPPYTSFMDDQGTRAEPFQLRFEAR